MTLILTFFCSDEDLSNALDSDEILNDSIGGLGQQIEKLSSNTLEFCDSIDERTSSKKPCTASHSESESQNIFSGNYKFTVKFTHQKFHNFFV